MAQLLVTNLPPALIESLRARATANGRSVEAEHRAILEEALIGAGNPFRVRAGRLRVQTVGKIRGDSTDLIRSDRDDR